MYEWQTFVGHAVNFERLNLEFPKLRELETDMTNVLLNAAIHNLIKSDEGAYTIVHGPTDMAADSIAQRVTDHLFLLYNRRSSKSFGRFSDDKDNYPTKDYFDEYLDKEDFENLTFVLMKRLKHLAANEYFSDGGFVFFAHFEREGKHYFLVTILKSRWGARLSPDLYMQELDHLDIDGFRFAGRINITGWKSDEKRYISFLKGKGDVSKYFRDFFGCDTASKDQDDTNSLVDALKAFSEKAGMAREDQDKFLEKARSIGERYNEERKFLELDALANELVPENPQPLREYLADPDLALTDGFIPHRGALRRLLKIKGSSKLWNIEFERKAISQGEIVYNKEEKSLTIKNLPDGLIREIQDQFDT